MRIGQGPPRWQFPKAASSRTGWNRGATVRLPKTPACYGFSIVAKVIPGREEKFHEHARTIEKTIAARPDALAVLKLHYLRWLMFPIKGETCFMYQGIFDTDFDKYTEDAVALFSATWRSDSSWKISKDSLWSWKPIRHPSSHHSGASMPHFSLDTASILTLAATRSRRR